MDETAIRKALEGKKGDRTALVTALQDVQRAAGWLPRRAVEIAAAELGVPLSRAYSVATFYKAFSLAPKGEKVIRLCKGTACHIRGAPQLEEMICAETGALPGRTTEDLKYTFEIVNCLGACAMAPVMVVNGKYHGNVKPAKVRKLLKGE